MIEDLRGTGYGGGPDASRRRKGADENPDVPECRVLDGRRCKGDLSRSADSGGLRRFLRQVSESLTSTMNSQVLRCASSPASWPGGVAQISAECDHRAELGRSQSS